MFCGGLMDSTSLNDKMNYEWVEDFLEKKYSQQKKVTRKKEQECFKETEIEQDSELMKPGALYKIKVTALKAENKKFEKKFKFRAFSEDHPAILIEIGQYGLNNWFWGTTKKDFADKKLSCARKILSNSLGGVFTVIPGDANYVSPVTKERKISPDRITFFTIHLGAKQYSKIKAPFTYDLYCGRLNNDSLNIAFDIYAGRRTL